MCTVCGCAEGETRVEGEHGHHHHDEHHSHDHHDHGHQHGHSHHNHAHQHQSQHSNDVESQPVAIHHHYHHSGDVHHHIHYHVAAGSSEQPHGHSHASDHAHQHHHGEVKQQFIETFEPTQTNDDLHYGNGPAHAHAPGMSQHRMVQIEQDILGKNNDIADHNRAHFVRDNVFVMNLVSSPGSGKTTTLTETLKLLKDSTEMAVIEGDQETSNDAERIRATGVKAIQVNTGKGCHLDAAMIHKAYHQLEMPAGGVLFIENVGNLVCPAAFDLGEACKVAILSVTEGEDKPLKYPEMFAASELMLINKIDLLPHLNFDLPACIANARKVNPSIEVICLSATSGEGMDLWLEWIAKRAK
ncbi:hydrogenase nickel incorporation protein HypB [Ferrimonas lipolytica]|uniref:Hydrogenase maturation factor HypB n=1 Tax=Ferrimonas lipolytica TaxID=2724191 RepID=A0A6H1UBJ7_9GAMM|nr:hydrogenase nickel incorporation protein HypB [Ferrimonas lipolytica]QIZ76431.1 hydrogenase nickel incorporation protein HypB [Ferrimonas lipolytica]